MITKDGNNNNAHYNTGGNDVRYWLKGSQKLGWIGMDNKKLSVNDKKFSGVQGMINDVLQNDK